jgi:hypothetical protein
MKTVIKAIKFTARILLFIILLPAVLMKYLRFKFIFKRNLTKYGIPNDQAKLLVKEIGIKNILNFDK